MGMEVDIEMVVDEKEDKLQNVKDLQMLEQLHLGNDNDDIESSDSVDYDMVANDDETYDPASPGHEVFLIDVILYYFVITFYFLHHFLICIIYLCLIIYS
jgi:hypothetical protein